MSPVTVPSAVARSQFVVQVNATQVNVLENDRWASPLADEIHNAMLAAVSRQSGAVDVHGIARADNVAVYDLSVDVRRFETWPGSYVLIDVVWTVRPSNSQETMTCHSVVSRSVSVGYDAVVDGHRQALQRIATQIAQGIRELVKTSAAHLGRQAATRSMSCPSMVEAETRIDAAVSGATQ
jgi:uncharacterized lipoprotein YmbA